MKPGPFTHCVFDAYGTLFDVHSAVGRYREVLGKKPIPSPFSGAPNSSNTPGCEA
ncbi:MAG: hypothetical protein VX080_01200 [SAR324 cluster bacterium]|nr:hypothetical protein [SAR324 cluster bacterium]